MKGADKLINALIEVSKENGYIANLKVVNDISTLEIKTPDDNSTIFILQPPFNRNKRGIYYIKNINQLSLSWYLLFSKRTLEKEIERWTKYIRNYPKRLKRMEVKEKLKSMNEDF